MPIAIHVVQIKTTCITLQLLLQLSRPADSLRSRCYAPHAPHHLLSTLGLARKMQRIEANTCPSSSLLRMFYCKASGYRKCPPQATRIKLLAFVHALIPTCHQMLRSIS